MSSGSKLALLDWRYSWIHDSIQKMPCCKVAKDSTLPQVLGARHREVLDQVRRHVRQQFIGCISISYGGVNFSKDRYLLQVCVIAALAS